MPLTPLSEERVRIASERARAVEEIGRAQERLNQLVVAEHQLSGILIWLDGRIAQENEAMATAKAEAEERERSGAANRRRTYAEVPPGN